MDGVKQAVPSAIEYPFCDASTLDEFTLEMRRIFFLTANLVELFRDRDDVSVASNLMWFPVEARPDIRFAPEVSVVFGRPKRDRVAYKQWEEIGVPITVAFDVMQGEAPASRSFHRDEFYYDYGLEERYLYFPDVNRLYVYVRDGDGVVLIRRLEEFVSPRMGLRFRQTNPELTFLNPNGSPFLPIEELAVRVAERSRAERAAQWDAKDVQRARLANQDQQRDARLARRRSM
ncbi:MAG: hypothetical protein U0736_17035 [Gemmataceae bacterium]